MNFYKMLKIIWMLVLNGVFLNILCAQSLILETVVDEKILKGGINEINITYKLKNNTSESFSDIRMSSSIQNWRTGVVLQEDQTDQLVFNSNMNQYLKPGEEWTYQTKANLAVKMAEVLVVKAGVKAVDSNGSNVLVGDAEMLYAHGVNMDVELDGCIFFGQTNDISLRSRLLIDEDAAKDPGTTSITVGGITIEILLPQSRWEARDEVLHLDMINGNEPLDPFNPPADITVSILCDQDNVDGGRITNQVLDECEPVNTVRAPCVDFGEDDVLCEFPDWEFCVTYFIPNEPDIPDSMIVKDENGVPVVPATIKVTASDQFNIWYCEESPPGSGNYTDFILINENGGSGNVDCESSLLKPGGIIPVSLISFEAQLNNDVTALFWSTVSEVNSNRFEIQRSKDGISFEAIGSVDAHGNSSEKISYQFHDQTPGRGQIYYRLKVLDLDGVFDYSEIISVFNFGDLSNHYEIVPNPAEDQFMIKSDIGLDEMFIEIYNVQGKLMKSEYVNDQKNIDISQLLKGMYVVNIYDVDKAYLEAIKLSVQ